MHKAHLSIALLLAALLLTVVLTAGCASNPADVARDPSDAAPPHASEPGDDPLAGWPAGTTVRILGPSTAWAVEREGGDFRILRLWPAMGGWTDVTPAHIPGPLVQAKQSPAVSFVNDHVVYIALAAKSTDSETGAIRYEDYLLSTRNGGQSWSAAKVVTGDRYDVPINLAFKTDEIGWLLTERDTGGGDAFPTRKLFETRDAGETWSLIGKDSGSAGP